MRDQKYKSALPKKRGGLSTHLPRPSQDDNDSDEETLDPWDRMNASTRYVFNDNTYRSPLPDRTAMSSPTTPHDTPIPPCFVAQVHSLPRGVDIEWSATGLTSPSIHLNRSLAHRNLTITSPSNSRSSFYTLEIREQSDINILRKLGEHNVRDWTSATLYVAPSFEWNAKMSMRGVQWIPCRRVWGEDGREVRAVLVGRVDKGDDLESLAMSKKLMSGLRLGSG